MAKSLWENKAELILISASISFPCHHRAAASRECAKAHEWMTLRDPVIHEGVQYPLKVIMDYRVSSRQNRSLRSRGTTAR
jgi:hypothetical protein